MNLSERVIDDLMFLFDRLLSQRGDAQWVERHLEETAWLLVDIDYESVVGYEHQKEVVEYCIRHVRREAKAIAGRRLNSQKRRHDYRHNFKTKDWLEVVNHFGYRCAYCGSDDDLTIDHFKPFSKGGELVKDNIIPACSRCNSSKSNHDFEEWYTRQNFATEDKEDKIINFINKN